MVKTEDWKLDIEQTLLQPRPPGTLSKMCRCVVHQRTLAFEQVMPVYCKSSELGKYTSSRIGVRILVPHGTGYARGLPALH